MTISLIAYGGPRDERRRLLDDVVGMPDLYLNAQGDTLDQLIAYFDHGQAMVVVLGANHFPARERDETVPTESRFWRAVDWLRCNHPHRQLVVWADRIEPPAVEQLLGAGVRGIVWSEDWLAGQLSLVVRTVMCGAVVVSRPRSAYAGWTTEARPPYVSPGATQ